MEISPPLKVGLYGEGRNFWKFLKCALLNVFLVRWLLQKGTIPTIKSADDLKIINQRQTKKCREKLRCKN
jgi:hypothetical protein